MWFDEPEGWMKERISDHQAIRDSLVEQLEQAGGFDVRKTEAGSYLFPRIKDLSIPIQEFVKILRAQASVIVTPGTEFGPQFTDSFRINFSQDQDAATDAMDRIIQVAKEYRS